MFKISFSRKGFDSTYGGKSSPILPDGRLISLPIPQSDGLCSFRELKVDDNLSFEELFNALGYEAMIDAKCHLDPDIYPKALQIRMPGWKPSLGHTEQQSHLSSHGFSVGDIFLFYGMFRKTALDFKRNIVWDKKDKQKKHIMWGYLEVGEILPVRQGTQCPEWLERHPHTCPHHRVASGNTIYISSYFLTMDQSLPGAGVFKYSDDLTLTKDGLSLTKWDRNKLEFMKDYKISRIAKDAWADNNYFQSVNIGQEIIITPTDDGTKLKEWVLRLIRNNLYRN